MTTTRANRILAKALGGSHYGAPSVRRATRREEQVDEYGTKLCWVIDKGELQILQAYPTLAKVVAVVLEQCWEHFDGSALTDKERRELRAIPSNVASLI